LKNEVYKVEVHTREALIGRIRNTATKKGMKQLGEQQAPFVDEAVNGGIFEYLIKARGY
jgi:hypothetical protein